METTKKLLGCRIKELRKLRRLSHEELSEKVDIDPKYLSRIEVRRIFPFLDTLERLANVLNIELKDFFEFSHETPSLQKRDHYFTEEVLIVPIDQLEKD